MSLIDSLTLGQWLVLASFVGAAFCTKAQGMQRTALWFSALFALNYIWLKWTAVHLEISYAGFYLLRIAAELVIILAIIRHAGKLAKWLVWLQVWIIAANLVAMAAPLHEVLLKLHPYKKPAVLALESLQVFGVFFFASPIYRHLYGQPAKKDQHTWLARSMTQRHI